MSRKINNDMKQETYIQLSLFNEADNGIKHNRLLYPALLDVINHFILIQRSIDPVWWSCRWSDMVVYTTTLNPNQKPKGCMSSGKEYPFNVWQFVKQANKDEFINNGIAQVIKSWA